MKTTTTTNDKSHRWLAIVNPIAGRGCGLNDWPAISSHLFGAGILFDAMFTERKFHATEITVDAVNQGYRKIIIVGGDGTIHEIVHGLMLQQKISSKDVLLSVIAVGTGNDWIRMFGISKTYPEAVKAIVDGHSFLQDIGRVTYHETRVPQTRYLANVGGIAYDAEVCRGFNKLHQKGRNHGKWLYVLSAMKQAVLYKCKSVIIEADREKIFEGKLFTATIAINKYTGGGLSQTPLAIADDGLFDITIIPKMNRFMMFMKHWHRIYDDSIYKIPRVTHHRAAHLIIKSQPPISLELDGEILGKSGFDFRIIERAIRVVVSEKFLNEK